MKNSLFKKLFKFIRYVKVYKKLNKNRTFWRNYYRQHRDNSIPSDFAVECMKNYISKDNYLLELGCGNGRDAFYFAHNGVNVHALDIENEEIQYLNKKNTLNNLKFMAKDFSKYQNFQFYDYIYSRFTLHSISDIEEEATIENSYNNLKDNGLFFIEVRSTKDNMFEISTKISSTEGETDHYRRFIEYENILDELKTNNFNILYSIESNGLAKYKNEDPVIIRIIAQKH